MKEIISNDSLEYLSMYVRRKIRHIFPGSHCSIEGRIVQLMHVLI